MVARLLSYGYDSAWLVRWRRADAWCSIARRGSASLDRLIALWPWPARSVVWAMRRRDRLFAASMRAAADVTHSFGSQFETKPAFDRWHSVWRRSSLPPASTLEQPPGSWPLPPPDRRTHARLVALRVYLVVAVTQVRLFAASCRFGQPYRRRAMARLS